MAEQRVARTILIANFVPGFVLCTVYSGLTSRATLGLGVIPLSISSAFGLSQLITGTPPYANTQRRRDRTEEASISPDEDEDERCASEAPSIWVFLADIIVAALLITELIFVWIELSAGHCYRSWRCDPGIVTVAAYATVPLLINFLIHVWLAVRALAVGLGIDRFLRSTFRRTSLDCPHCGVHVALEPAGPPPPWLRNFFRPPIQLRTSDLPIPATGPSVSNAKGPADWVAPAWAKSQQQQDLVPLLAGAEGSREPYHDEYDEDAIAIRTSIDAAPESNAAPAPEAAVTTKNDKGKETSPSS